MAMTEALPPDPYFDNEHLAEFEIPISVREARGRYNRWAAMRDHIDDVIARGEDFVTRGLLTEVRWRVLISEVLHGKTRDEENHPLDADMPLSHIPRVRLATVDGKPLALAKRDARGRIVADAKDPSAHMRGVKIGQRALDAKQLKRFRQIGREVGIYREYPADFEVRADEAWNLLARYGYRVVYPTYAARGTGNQHIRAMLFEVGGPFQTEVEAEFGWKDAPVETTTRSRKS